MSKKIPYRIPVCIFIFVVGSITALLFASVLNDVLTTGSISTDLTDFSTIFSGVFGGEKPRKLYLLLEALVVLLCVVYFVCAERTYQTETYKVTDNISVPVPSGQGQHGTAWFMSDKIKRRAFDYISISKADPLISRLVSIGEERYRAIENGEIFNPPKADQTLTDSAGIVLAREMSRGTERLPCITDDYHTLTIGATRCGKSRCLVLQSICALALAGEGIVANDPKGELYHYTHSFLETLGYKVHVIDFNTPKKSDRYNPLQSIINAVNENRIDDAQNCVWEFVTFLVEKNDHSEPIWTNGECSVIAAAVMCVVYDNQNHPEFQNLTNVYNFIANMCKTVNKVLPIDAYMDKLSDSHPAKKLMAIAKLAPDKMGGSFYTAALTTLRLFITNDIYSMTRESEFSLADVGTKPKQALFFILPDQKTTYYPIVTLLVSQQYELLVTYAKKCGNRLPHRVNYILDEFGNFAAIDKFQTKMTVAGGYGVRWNLFIQDFNQLIDVYGQEVAKIIQRDCFHGLRFQLFRVQYHPDNHFSHSGGNKRGVLEMKRLKKRMLANSGFSYVITSVLMICVLLIGVAVFEVIRLYIQAGAVRDKFEDSIISMCVENYSEMYGARVLHCNLGQHSESGRAQHHISGAGYRQEAERMRDRRGTHRPQRNSPALQSGEQSGLCPH